MLAMQRMEKSGASFLNKINFTSVFRKAFTSHPRVVVEFIHPHILTGKPHQILKAFALCRSTNKTVRLHQKLDVLAWKDGTLDCMTQWNASIFELLIQNSKLVMNCPTSPQLILLLCINVFIFFTIIFKLYSKWPKCWVTLQHHLLMHIKSQVSL